MKKFALILVLLTPILGSAQLFEGDEQEYNSEWIWGINKNSNSGFIGGFVLRYARSLGNDYYETFGLELSNVKHPSESRFVGVQGQGFNYGKTNYLYAIRLQYGREKLLFRKADQKGVQINAGAAVGPTIGLENPYYVLVNDNVYKQFEPIMTPDQIQGPGKLFQGLNESKVRPGINLKGSVSFEFGTYKSNVLGVEVGTMLEAYTKKIIIVPTQKNNSVFTSVFFTIFWGTRN